MKNLIVYGAGEFGSLIANVISYHDDLEIAAYGDDNHQQTTEHIDGVPVFGQKDLLNFAEQNNIKLAITAIGNNTVRAEKFNLLKNTGFQMISIVHPQALIDTKVSYGDNVIIEMGTAIHTNSKIGNNVFLGGEALIGHHNIIGDHVLVGGNVSFGLSLIHI